MKSKAKQPDNELRLHPALFMLLVSATTAPYACFKLAWNAYEVEFANGSKPDGITFRRVVADLVGPAVADWLEVFTSEPRPDFSPLIPPLE